LKTTALTELEISGFLLLSIKKPEFLGIIDELTKNQNCLFE